MDNTKIRLIFCRTTSWYDIFSYLVRFMTWSPWSHVGLLLDDETVIESAHDLGGVRTGTLAAFKSRCTTWEIREMTVSDALKIKQVAMAQVGEPYNWLSLLGIALHVGVWKGKGFFCSELVEYAFATAGQAIFNPKFMARITPQHLWMINSSFVANSAGDTRDQPSA